MSKEHSDNINRELQKISLKVSSGITPSNKELSVLQNLSENIQGSLIKKSDAHNAYIDEILSSSRTEYDSLNILLEYMIATLTKLEGALKSNDTDMTYGYMIDSIVVATKKFNEISKPLTIIHRSAVIDVTSYEMLEPTYKVSDFYKETQSWINNLRMVVGNMKRAVLSKDTESIYKNNEDFTVLRSNSKYLKFYLQDNMRTQR